MTHSTRLMKNEFRQSMKSKLAALAPDEYFASNSAIGQRFFELQIVQKAGRIMIYFAIGREVATASIISRLLEMGKTVALPACTADKNLKAGIINRLNELVPGKFGLSEPPVSALAIDPAALDLIVVPGVAFDTGGFRLGHGAGYYDRFLARTDAYKLGLAYDFQIVDHLARESHDVAVHALLTPSKYLEIR
jgi:5-formyltetrahydrofolate cyclo-ligase